MKQVHITRDHLTSIKLEVDIDMKLADEIYLTLHDRLIHIVKVRMGIEYPPKVPRSP